jgi:hypothetical protein
MPSDADAAAYLTDLKAWYAWCVARELHPLQAAATTSRCGREITGRSVIAFLSANHIDPDLAVETFILAPDAQTLKDPAYTQHADDGASRALIAASSNACWVAIRGPHAGCRRQRLSPRAD